MVKMRNIIRGLETLSVEMERIPVWAFFFLFSSLILFSVFYPVFMYKLRMSTLKREKYRKSFLFLSVFISFSFIVIVTLMNRGTMDTAIIKLNPFNSMFETTNLHREIAGDIANFYLFMPIGIVCAETLKDKFKVLKSCIIGLIGSLIIESIQLSGRIGVFDIDDIIFNTAGTLCGCFVVVLFQMKHHRHKIAGIFCKTAVAIAMCVFLLPALAFGSYHILKIYGKQEILSENISQKPSIISKEGETAHQDNILYKGKEYWYNPDNITILFMAIREEPNSKQLDSLALLTINPVHKQIYVVEIPDDTVAENTGQKVVENDMVLTEETLAEIYHKTSDEREKYQCVVSAVSRLFYNIPINGYIAFSMNTLRSICSSVGKISVVTDAERIVLHEPIDAGMPIKIDSNTIADYFIWKKNEIEPGDTSRIVRQTELVSELLNRYYCYWENEKVIFSGYQFLHEIKNRVITDLDAGRLTYFITELSKLNFTDDRIIMVLDQDRLRGDTEKFYVDEDAMYKLIVYEYYLRDYSD